MVDAHYVGERFSKSRLADMKQLWNLDSKCLGEGAYGKVYKATSISDPNRIVAVKIINKRGMDLFKIRSLE